MKISRKVTRKERDRRIRPKSFIRINGWRNGNIVAEIVDWYIIYDTLIDRWNHQPSLIFSIVYFSAEPKTDFQNLLSIVQTLKWPKSYQLFFSKISSYLNDGIFYLNHFFENWFLIIFNLFVSGWLFIVDFNIDLTWFFLVSQQFLSRGF